MATSGSLSAGVTGPLGRPALPFPSPARPLATSAAGAPAGKKPESPLAKLVIGGSITWLYELSCGHYMEFLKIAKQTQEGSYWQLTRQITAQKGLVGIWDGFMPWGSIQAVAKGAVFGWAHALAKSSLHPLVEDGTLPRDLAEVMAGGFGGGVQGLVLSPTLLLKTRVMTDPVFRSEMTMWQTTQESTRVGMAVIRNEGMRALMKGSVVFSAKRVADWSTRFFFSVTAENVLFKRGDPDRALSYPEKITASLAGGVLSALTTIPIDVMVAQIQQASKAGEAVSVVDTFRAQWAEGGFQKVAGFATRGFVARVAHVATTTALMKTAASIVYDKYQSM